MNRLLVIFLSTALLSFGVFHVLGDSDTASHGSAMSGPSVGNIASAPLDPPLRPGAPRSTPSSTAATAEPSSGPVPAWLQPTAPTAASNSTANSTTTVAASAPEKIARLSMVLEKLNRLQTQPNVDARAAAAAIAELEQINGSAVMNGVRLDVLRENVEVADRIQTAAADLQRLQKSSAVPSPEQAALVQAKAAELAALQSRIRYDITQSPGAGAATGTRP